MKGSKENPQDLLYMNHALLPTDLVHKIFEYDGRIRYERGKYINVIHKHDERYTIVHKKVERQIEIMKKTEIRDGGFYLEFSFEIDYKMGLCYDYNFSYDNKFEICYFDFRYDYRGEITQIRTEL